MIKFNGKVFLKNVKKNIGATGVDGYYSLRKRGVMFFDLERIPMAYLANDGRNSWLVSAYLYQGDTYYMNCTTDKSNEFLGFEGRDYKVEKEVASEVWASVQALREAA